MWCWPWQGVAFVLKPINSSGMNIWDAWLGFLIELSKGIAASCVLQLSHMAPSADTIPRDGWWRVPSSAMELLMYHPIQIQAHQWGLVWFFMSHQMVVNTKLNENWTSNSDGKSSYGRESNVWIPCQRWRKDFHYIRASALTQTLKTLLKVLHSFLLAGIMSTYCGHTGYLLLNQPWKAMINIFD